MKKVYSVIIALVLIVGVFSTIAYAQSGSHEKIDLTEYSLEELIELHEDVRAELIDRLHLNEDALIGRGEYIVGKDIKAGTYTFTVTETDYDDEEIDNAFYLQNSDGTYAATAYDIPIGEKTVLSLTDGQTLKIQRCVCVVTISNPIWAP